MAIPPSSLARRRISGQALRPSLRGVSPSRSKIYLNMWLSQQLALVTAPFSPARRSTSISRSSRRVFNSTLANPRQLVQYVRGRSSGQQAPGGDAVGIRERRDAGLVAAPSSVNGEHLLWFAHAPERVPTHRRQLLSRSLRGLHERRGNQDWLPQLFAQSLEARSLIHGRADYCEVEAVGGAYVAVRDFASMQRNVQAERRIAGRGLCGV